VARTALRLLVPALALACGAWLACASPEERFAEHVARAEAHAEAGRSEEALLELQSALKIDPQSAEVNQRLGELLADQGAHQPAVFHFGEAYRLDPTRVEAAMRQAALLWRSQPRRAERIVARAKRRHPDDSRVLRTESALALVLGDPDRALAAAEEATRIAPDDPESWVQLGLVHAAHARAASRRRGAEIDTRPHESAIAALARVDELTGGHVGARVETGRVYALWPGHGDQATRAFRDAVRLAAEQGDATQAAAAAAALEEHARRVGSPELRAEALRHRVEATPEDLQAWERLAQVRGRLEGPEAAEAVLHELVEARPDLPGAHVTYTQWLVSAQRSLDAIAHLDRVLSAEGDAGLDHPLLWEQLVRLEVMERRLPDARATFAEMAERHPDHEITRRTEARLALLDGRAEDAEDILAGVPGAEASAETERLRAMAELQQGNTGEALAAVERAISLAPGFSAPAVRLAARIHAEARDWARALDALDALGDRGLALSSEERLIRARALYARGDAEAGRKALEQLLASPVAPPAAAVEYAQREGGRRPDVARAYLAHAHRRAPGNFDVIEGLTRLDLRAGDATRALQRLDRVVESQLAGPRILLLRAEVLARGGELERAEADALRAFEAAPDLSRAVDLLFAIYRAQDKLDEARRSFEEAESVGVLHAGARVLLGRLYLAQGDAEKARAMYERVIEDDPGLAPAKNDLAFLLATRGEDLERAARLAEEAQRALPDSANAADTVGYVYYRQGRHEEALPQLRYAIEQAEPGAASTATFHYHLGLTLDALARDGEAASHFERALALDPSFPSAADARARLESARGSAEPDAGSPG